MIASPRGLGPEKDCAGKGQQHYKRQTLPVVREDAPQKQDRNCQAVINIFTLTLIEFRGSSIREVVKIQPERVKLKDLHC
jgi:hypothetical protein